VSPFSRECLASPNSEGNLHRYLNPNSKAEENVGDHSEGVVKGAESWAKYDDKMATWLDRYGIQSVLKY